MIYHIATRADWERACADGEYTTSTLGKTLAEQGFIHACTAAQVSGVANMFYRGVREDLVVLVIDTGRLRAPVRYEQVGEAAFPHIYGPVQRDAVLAVRPLTAGPDGEFAFSP